MALKHEDTVAGGAVALAGLIVGYLALDIRAGATGNTLPPNFFPLLCAGGMMICGVVILARGLMSDAGPLPTLIDRRVAIVGGLTFIYYWFFAWLDFRLAAAVLTVATMLAFGIRSWLQLVVVPLVLSVGLYFAFTRGFQLVLPTWI